MNDAGEWPASGPGNTTSGSGVRTFGLIVIGALIAVLVGGVGLLFGLQLGKGDSEPVEDLAAATIPVAATVEPTAVTEEPRDAVHGNAELAERYGRSVFKVETDGCGMEGWGTAWVLDDKHLVTNWHVVSSDPTPNLVSRDGATRFSGEVIGGQIDPDVAVIRVDEKLPDALPWADTDDLREGQEIVSLGFPAPVGDFSVTPSTIISFQRSGSTREAIRGDGALDRGNSGGPALTRDGAVAGVATVMVQEANQLQMVPLLFTADALQRAVDDILATPEQVEAECEPQYAMLPEGWESDFDDWFTPGPQAYGDDATLDRLYDSCSAGDLGACDDLYWASAFGSEYEAFAISCGGTSDGAYGSCEASADWDAQVAEWEAEEQRQEEERQQEERRQEEERQQEERAQAQFLAALLTSCQSGDMQACDDLQGEAGWGSTEYEVAWSCGGHYPDGYGACVDREAEAAELSVLVGQCQAGDMQACDDLFWASGYGTPEEAVAENCGGFYPRQGGMCVYTEENG